MLALALLVAFASCFYAVIAQEAAGFDASYQEPWVLNVSVGGMFDEMPFCSVSLLRIPMASPCSIYAKV